MTDEDLRAKYEIASECPLTLNHANTHIDNAKDCIASDPKQAEHDLLVAVQILRATMDTF